MVANTTKKHAPPTGRKSNVMAQTTSLEIGAEKQKPLDVGQRPGQDHRIRSLQWVSVVGAGRPRPWKSGYLKMKSWDPRAPRSIPKGPWCPELVRTLRK
ncbi:hypothetical protein RB213_008152 [Colletotrichum asianum]